MKSRFSFAGMFESGLISTIEQPNMADCNQAVFEISQDGKLLGLPKTRIQTEQPSKQMKGEEEKIKKHDLFYE